MEIAQKQSLYITRLEQVFTMKDRLRTLKDEAFDKESGHIAAEYKINPSIIRAIGKGNISEELSVNENIFYIQSYINFPHPVLSEKQKIENLAKFFHVNEGMIERIKRGEVIPDDEIDVYREIQEEEVHEALKTKKEREGKAPAEEVVEEEVNQAPLSDEAKDFIREYVAEGTTEDERKALRKEMSEEFGVSINVIGSITAWKINVEGEKKVLKKALTTEEPEVVPPEDEPVEVIKEENQESQSPIEEVQTKTKEGVKKVFTDAEKEIIRRRICIALIEGWDDGATEEKLKLVEEFGGTEGQLNAMGAHFKIYPDSVAPSDLVEALKEKLKAEGQTWKEAKPKKPKKKEKKSAINKELPSHQENCLNEKDVLSTEQLTQIEEEFKKDGAHFEYDNKIKNEWREKKENFIEKETHSEERKNMKVILFPGKKWLDFKHYKKLGFSPENIIGIERDKSIKDEFEQKGANLGCKTHFGELKNLIEQGELNEIFDIVDLDFTGELSESALKIIKNVKTKEKFLLLTNFSARREHSEFIKSMMKYMKFGTMDYFEGGNKMMLEYQKNLISGNGNISKMFYENADTLEEIESAPLCEARERISEVIMTAPYLNINKIKELNLTDNAFFALVTYICNKLANTNQEYAHSLQVIANRALFGDAPYHSAIKEYSYQNKNGTPFYSQFTSLEKKESFFDQKNTQKFTEILEKILSTYKNQEETKLSIYFATQNGRSIPKNQASENDNAIVKINGKTIAKISRKHIEKMTDAYGRTREDSIQKRIEINRSGKRRQNLNNSEETPKKNIAPISPERDYAELIDHFIKHTTQIDISPVIRYRVIQRAMKEKILEFSQHTASKNSISKWILEEFDKLQKAYENGLKLINYFPKEDHAEWETLLIGITSDGLCDNKFQEEYRESLFNELEEIAKHITKHNKTAETNFKIYLFENKCIAFCLKFLSNENPNILEDVKNLNDLIVSIETKFNTNEQLYHLYYLAMKSIEVQSIKDLSNEDIKILDTLKRKLLDLSNQPCIDNYENILQKEYNQALNVIKKNINSEITP